MSKNVNKILLAVVIVVVALILVIIFTLNPNTPSTGSAASKSNTIKINNLTGNTNQNQVNPSETVPTGTVPAGTSSALTAINPTVTSADPAVTMALSSMPGSDAAPKQAVIKAEEIPSAAIKLSVSDSGFTPKEFTINSGQEVSLAITAVGSSTHVFIFPMASLMGLQTMVSNGETKMITFTAPNAGTYTFRDDIPDFRKNTGSMIVK